MGLNLGSEWAGRAIGKKYYEYKAVGIAIGSRQGPRDCSILKNSEFNEVKGSFVGFASQGFNLDEFNSKGLHEEHGNHLSIRLKSEENQKNLHRDGR
jgi:hypothetical protein